MFNFGNNFFAQVPFRKDYFVGPEALIVCFGILPHLKGWRAHDAVSYHVTTIQFVAG
jgi:hypothetical protein